MLSGKGCLANVVWQMMSGNVVWQRLSGKCCVAKAAWQMLSGKCCLAKAYSDDIQF
jgi:hypothetical protein